MTELEADDELDATLVARALGGDRHAFADLVRRHQARALRLAYVICGSTQEAEDAVQEAFVKAHAALSRVRPDSPVRPWLMKIVANTARNRRRSGIRRDRVTTRFAAMAVTPGAGPDDAALATLRDDALWAALGRLGQRDRRVLGLRYLADMTEAETAAALGVAPGTVKSRTSRALARLHALIGEDGHGR
jgi:RNA polymerase sigma-70 factor (ECF subfamily)